MPDPFDERDQLKDMNQVPQVPTFLDRVDYGNLPRQVADALEQSGIVGYLTYNEQGQDAFRILVDAATRACTFDALTAKIEAELFIRSMCAGWIRFALDETQTNSVAATADEFYKGLFAAKQDTVSRKQITSTGMKGFQEESTPSDWDMALGSVKGFRKWTVNILGDDQVLQGSYSKDFLSHEMLEDGRRVGTCHQGGSTHPPEEVPADDGCGCGWWAYWSPEEARKHSGGSGGDNVQVFSITVGVEGSGRAVIGQKGFRSQYLRITGIAPDEKCDDEGLATLAAFSRKHLLDAPVYRGVDALREGVGVDPQYGTLGARYPELSNHTDRTLTVYVWFLQHVRQDCENHMFNLRSGVNSLYADHPNTLSPPNYADYSVSANNEQKFNYLKISSELLENELKTVSKILNERGPGYVHCLTEMQEEEANRRIFPA